MLKKEYLGLLLLIFGFTSYTHSIFINYRELLSEQNFDEQNDDEKPFFEQADLDEMLLITQEIFDLYPYKSCTIYGLGNTPAPLIAMLQLMVQAQPEDYKHIALSRGQMPLPQALLFKDFKPLKESFYNYLDSIGLNPIEVSESEKNIVIIDMIATGNTVIGFMNLLEKYYSEILGKEIGLKVLHEKFNFYFFVMPIKESLIHNMPEWAQEKIIYKNYYNFIAKYSNATPEERIIKYFPYELWNDNPFEYMPQPNGLKILNEIKNYIETITFQ